MSGTTWTIKSKSERKENNVVVAVYYDCVRDDSTTPRKFNREEVKLRTIAGEVFTTEGGKRVHCLIKSGRSVGKEEEDNLEDVVPEAAASVLEKVMSGSAEKDADDRLENVRELLRRHWAER
ncbi:hypothetical protein [Nannocystis pusilla]|uniref:hypothetical protein n=1 Tax=Nannocystis pusilla TaxID=889268 RepID=UPI003DA31B79